MVYLFASRSKFFTRIHSASRPACINRPNTLLLYTDEDIINTEGQYSQPKLKPDINIELLRSSPYIGAATLIRKPLMLDPRIAILPLGLVRNYGAALLAIEQGPTAVEHFDEVLVHVSETPRGRIHQYRACSSIGTTAFPRVAVSLRK